MRRFPARKCVNEQIIKKIIIQIIIIINKTNWRLMYKLRVQVLTVPSVIVRRR